MAKTAINYLFPSNQITKLPTWRFVLHFMVPVDYRPEMLATAISNLKSADWKVVMFPLGIESLALDPTGKAVGVPIEVPEDRRRRPGSLADYESDVWKIMGNMVTCGFGDLYYEAVDWK
jgi:hypothetical protein